MILEGQLLLILDPWQRLPSLANRMLAASVAALTGIAEYLPRSDEYRVTELRQARLFDSALPIDRSLI